MIYRDLSETIKRMGEYFPVLTVTGPRQSGKTTLCKELFPEYAYYNLEDLELRERIAQDPKAFLAKDANIVIDEAQVLPELFPLIQVFVDQDKDRHFVLIGSSNFSLLQSITQSLAGRTAVLTLLPLSVKELDDAGNAIDTDKLILRGGYPKLWEKPDFPQDAFYRNYYATYVERDVHQLINVKDMTLFQKFIRLCAGRIGSEFNASSMSNETGVAASTITSWLSVLSASYVVWLLPPYFANVGKRLVKTPKLYFYDTGLACWLLGIESEAQLSSHPLRGNLFENMVVNEAVKGRFNAGKDPSLYFFRDKSGHEIDLVQDRGPELYAYEIKSAQTFNQSFFSGLKYFRNVFGDVVRRTAVIYDGGQEASECEFEILNYRDLSAFWTN